MSALAAQNAVLGARARLASAFGGPADTEGPDLQRTIILGFAIIALFLGGFGAWAALAPLRGAVIAPGAVTIDVKRKTIQHLEGGIVREIDVRDGEKVRADQVLLRLDDTQASANLQQVTGRYDAAAALVARLTAEELGQTEITFPPSLLARRDDPAVAKLMQGQETIFKARLNELNSETQILEQRDGQAAEIVAVIKVCHQDLKDMLRCSLRWWRRLEDRVKQWLKVFTRLIDVAGGSPKLGIRVQHREVELVLFGIKIDEEVIDFVQDFLRASIGAVDLVDDKDRRQSGFQRLAQHVSRLRQRTFAGVHK